MDGFEATTWRAIGITLTLLGLAISAVIWKRRGPASGIRAIAWSLLPAAAGLTGTLRLLWQIADSIGNWAVRLVFSPVVWFGLVLAGVSVVLFIVSGAMRNRGQGQPSGPGGALPASRSSRKAQPAKAQPDDESEDIEAILRRHGIT